MKLNIPDVFTDLMKEIEGYIGKYSSPSPSALIDVLEWASKNLSEAKNIVDGVKDLNTVGKKEFIYYIFSLNYEPDKALRHAIQHQEKDSEKRSLLAKITVNARNESGYFFKTVGGAECVVKKDKPSYYTFNFNAEGVDVAVYHGRHNLVEFVKSLTEKKRSVFYYNVGEIVLGGKKYLCYKGPGKKILQAIKENTNPFVFAVVE